MSATSNSVNCDSADLNGIMRKGKTWYKICTHETLLETRGDDEMGSFGNWRSGLEYNLVLVGVDQNLPQIELLDLDQEDDVTMDNCGRGDLLKWLASE